MIVKIEAVTRGFFQNHDRIAALGQSSMSTAVTTAASMLILIRAFSITRTSLPQPPWVVGRLWNLRPLCDKRFNIPWKFSWYRVHQRSSIAERRW